MSDFDKEAEREKLREKYEQEQREREATEKMSELLLQGATMTNAHCSDCGDPIFRYDGQEFCATCEKAVDRGDEGEDAEDGAADTAETGEDTENIEVTSPDDGARVSFGGENAEDGSETEAEPRQDTGMDAERAQRASQDAPDPQQSRTQPSRTQPSRTQPSRTEQPREVPSVESSSSPSSVDVTAARDSLVRTLTRFSQQAEATEDPQRAQEYLAAAREAAETLAALRQ